MGKVYYICGIPYPDELYHYGIIGQKWGIRRFQNTDGSLTAEGRERYGKAGSGKNQKDHDNSSKPSIHDRHFFEGEQWKNTTNSSNDFEYYSWEYLYGKANKGNKKAVDAVMNDGRPFSSRIKDTAKEYFKTDKDCTDKYIKYEKEIANARGMRPEDMGVNVTNEIMLKKYPDYATSQSKRKALRKKLIQSINNAVESGMLDKAFAGYPPISYKDDGYGEGNKYSVIADGRKEVIATYVNNEYGNTPEYSSYGFDYLNPGDFAEWRETSTGKKVNVDAVRGG